MNKTKYVVEGSKTTGFIVRNPKTDYVLDILFDSELAAKKVCRALNRPANEERVNVVDIEEESAHE